MTRICQTKAGREVISWDKFALSYAFFWVDLSNVSFEESHNRASGPLQIGKMPCPHSKRQNAVIFCTVRGPSHWQPSARAYVASAFIRNVVGFWRSKCANGCWTRREARWKIHVSREVWCSCAIWRRNRRQVGFCGFFFTFATWTNHN